MIHFTLLFQLCILNWLTVKYKLKLQNFGPTVDLISTAAKIFIELDNYLQSQTIRFDYVA